MAKMIIWGLCTVSILAQNITLKQACLACHQNEQIPSSILYRRYLMKFSSPKRIEEAMFAYLQHPKKADSIMPPQFFFKFPMKAALGLDDTVLREQIKAYIQTFDIKKKLRINQ